MKELYSFSSFVLSFKVNTEMFPVQQIEVKTVF